MHSVSAVLLLGKPFLITFSKIVSKIHKVLNTSENYSLPYYFFNEKLNFFSIFVEDGKVFLIYSTKNQIAGVIPNHAFGY